MKKKLLAGLAVSVMMFGAAGWAEATLIGPVNQQVIDGDLGVAWMDDANNVYRTSYDPDGVLNQQQAMNWAEQLVYGGFNDWRLPTDKEFDHLFYNEFGGTSFLQHTTTLSADEIKDNKSKFETGLWPAGYWTSTWGLVYRFDFGWGSNAYIYSEYRCVAVRDISQLNSPVPEPATILLMGTGLAGLVVAHRKKKVNKPNF